MPTVGSYLLVWLSCVPVKHHATTLKKIQCPTIWKFHYIKENYTDNFHQYDSIQSGKTNFTHLIHVSNKENSVIMRSNIHTLISLQNKNHVLQILAIQQRWHLHDVLPNYDNTIWKTDNTVTAQTPHNCAFCHPTPRHSQLLPHHSPTLPSTGTWNKIWVLKFSCKVQLEREVRGGWLITSALFQKEPLIYW